MKNEKNCFETWKFQTKSDEKKPFNKKSFGIKFDGFVVVWWQKEAKSIKFHKRKWYSIWMLVLFFCFLKCSNEVRNSI